MSEEIHSCSWFCDRPECVRAQRDSLRDRFVTSASPRVGTLPPLPECAVCHIETRLEYKTVAGEGRPRLEMWYVCPQCQSITRPNQ